MPKTDRADEIAREIFAKCYPNGDLISACAAALRDYAKEERERCSAGLITPEGDQKGTRMISCWHKNIGDNGICLDCGKRAAIQLDSAGSGHECAPEWATKAKEIRRHWFPWDEYPHIAKPGGIADQMERAILIALRDAYHAGQDDAIAAEAPKQP